MFEGCVAGQGLTSNREFDVRSLDPYVRADRQVEVDEVVAEHEGFAHRSVGAVDRNTERAGECDIRNSQRHSALDPTGNTVRREHERTACVGDRDTVGAVAQAETDVRCGDLDGAVA